MYIKNKRGQSTVEYVLLVTAVVAVMIALVTSDNGGFKSQLNSTLNTAINEWNGEITTLSDSHNSPAGTDSGAPTQFVIPVSENGT